MRPFLYNPLVAIVIIDASVAYSHFQKQKEDLECTWTLPHDFVVAYSEVQGEVEVGGVYLRLFIQQPSWVSDPSCLVLVDMAIIFYVGIKEAKRIPYCNTG